MNGFLHNAGARVIASLEETGRIGLLAGESFATLVTRRPRWRETLRQLFLMGAQSQTVIIITGLFTGLVFAVQTYYQFHKVQMDTLVGAVVSIAMTTELGPVLAALMVAGRVGAAMAAELGTMKVTEQIDALRSIGVHPTDYLVVPRLAAMVAALPILTLEAIAVGIVGGYLLIVRGMGVDGGYYMSNMIAWTMLRDFGLGMIKAACFAVLVVLVSCSMGLSADGGAEGVGRATNRAVVASSIAVLIANFFLTVLYSSIFPR